MLVSHTHKFIYLRTRKTAGTSLELALERYCIPPSMQLRKSTPAVISKYGIVSRKNYKRKKLSLARFTQFDWRIHQSAAHTRLYLGGAKWDSYRKFTTVRNPYDRMVSYFHFFKLGENIPENSDFAQVRDKFRDFVLNEDWHDDFKIVSLKGRYIIDHAVRMEYLPDDLKLLAKNLELAPDTIEIGHSNSTASSRKTYEVPEYYDQSTIQHVRNRMSWVFDHFDYPTEPVPKC